MKTVKVFIEIADFGYSAYMDDNDLNYGLIGEGKTVEETMSDFMVGYKEMKRFFESRGKVFEEAQFEFCENKDLGIFQRCQQLLTQGLGLST